MNLLGHSPAFDDTGLREEGNGSELGKGIGSSMEDALCDPFPPALKLSSVIWFITCSNPPPNCPITLLAQMAHAASSGLHTEPLPVSTVLWKH